jgi:hypothetical protein
LSAASAEPAMSDMARARVSFSDFVMVLFPCC